MEHRTSEELNVEVYHVPLQVVAACHPVVVVDGLVALNVHEVVRGGEVAVEIRRGHDDVGTFQVNDIMFNELVKLAEEKGIKGTEEQH